MHFPHYELAAYQAQYNSKARGKLGAATLELKHLNEILELASPAQLREWQQLKLSYAPERGSEALREMIAANYPELDADNVVVFSSATEALFCICHSEIKAGDHSSVIIPCYEPLAKIADSIGATVSSIALKHDEDSSKWTLDDGEISEAVQASDQLFINFPHNPSGALICQTQLDNIVANCQRNGTRLISDEVFNGLEHDTDTRLSPVACLSESGVSIGSIAKPHGVGGVRIGWAVSQDKTLLARAVACRRSLSVCSGTTDEWLARLVLEHSEALREASITRLKSHLALIEESLPLLAGKLKWTHPAAGCTAFPLLSRKGSNSEPENCADYWAQRCLEETGNMLVPGRCFFGGDSEQFSGGIRLGYGLHSFPETWQAFVEFLQKA